MKCQMLMILKNTKSATNILLTKLTSKQISLTWGSKNMYTHVAQLAPTRPFGASI